MTDLFDYYSKEEVDKFLWVLESILRGQDQGEVLVNGKILSVKIDVREKTEDDVTWMEFLDELEKSGKKIIFKNG